jgi:plasmid stability protein
MSTIQIKNVPDTAHAILRQRAAAAGQSLQEYLLGQIVASTRRPTLDEVLNRIEHRSGGSVPLAAAADQLRQERDSH